MFNSPCSQRPVYICLEAKGLHLSSCLVTQIFKANNLVFRVQEILENAIKYGKIKIHLIYFDRKHNQTIENTGDPKILSNTNKKKYSDKHKHLPRCLLVVLSNISMASST